MDIYPLGMTNSLPLKKNTIEIVDFPIKTVIFPTAMLNYQRVYILVNEEDIFPKFGVTNDFEWS